jgi:hypothetical protein
VPIVGNAAVEQAAIDFVIDQERLHGRSAKDTRGRGAGDVASEERVIEVKAFSGWWRSGLLYFTPPQLREGGQNADYYVYIVENIGQGDRSKFELRVLHGENLQRLFADAKPHRSYVPIRAADKARLERLSSPHQETSREEPDGARPTPVVKIGRTSLAARNRAKPILDTETRREYRSMSEAGKALAPLVGGDINNTFVWYQILRAFPNRFLTKNARGEWVALDDPSVPRGSTLPGS